MADGVLSVPGDGAVDVQIQNMRTGLTRFERVKHGEIVSPNDDEVVVHTTPAPEARRNPTVAVLQAIAKERRRQEQIGLRKRAQGIDWRSCADPLMAGGDATRFLVLGEEVGEVANAVLEAGYGKASDDAHLREELIQVAAVATAWVEAIDARNRA